MAQTLASPHEAPLAGAARSSLSGKVVLIAFLCGDDSASCHGGTYMVDGGFTAR